MDKKKEQREDETKVAVPSSEPLSRSPAVIAGRVAEQTILSAAARVDTLYAAVFLAFAGLFLMIAWQFGPLVLLHAHEYRKMTGHVDARIVESWLALEFDGYGMRVPRSSLSKEPSSQTLMDRKTSSGHYSHLDFYARPQFDDAIRRDV
jgi:hypothetical protein